DNVVRRYRFKRVQASEPFRVQDDLDARVQALERIPGRLGLASAYIRRAVENLALQIRELNRIKIDDTQPADPRRSEVHGNRRPQPAGTNAQHTGCTDFFLPLRPNLWQTQVA